MEKEKICPFSLASPRDRVDYCFEDSCALWEEFTAKFTATCSLKTLAYLKAIEITRKEIQE